jgi:hypothetical protein
MSYFELYFEFLHNIRISLVLMDYIIIMVKFRSMYITLRIIFLSIELDL